MKYEFQVNDAIETKSGTKGFILRIKYQDSCQIITICTYSGWYYTFAVPLGEFNGYDDIGNIFKRIGKYNFTENDKDDKIRPLQIDWWGNDAVDKINELVEVINELWRIKHDNSRI